MRLRDHVTFYRIERDHSREFGFFRFCVSEARQAGFGFQIALGKFVYGVSLHNRGQKERAKA